jgi:Ras-related protein Rab-21
MCAEVAIKVVLLGEGRCGKTSLLLRYVQGIFSDRQQATVQAAHLDKVIMIARKQVRLAIWDTAGQERFHALGPIYYRGAQAALLVYDLTDPDSFNRVRDWVRELRAECGQDIVLIIVGNKMDLNKELRVNPDDAEKYAQSIGAPHLMTSAKTGKGVDEVFLEVAKRALEKESNASVNSTPRKNMIEIVDEPQSSGKRCC